MDLTELADRVAIRRLVDEYATAADRRDGLRFAAVFTPDGVLVSPTGRHVGHGALGSIPAKLARYDRTFHLVANHMVDLGPDCTSATGETCAEAHHWSVAGDGTEQDRVLSIRYHDRFACTVGDDGTRTWHIAERVLEMVAVDVRTVTPG